MTGVVIITHNSEGYIKSCLQSVFQQDVPVEVLVVDNASDDETSAVIEERFAEVELLWNADNVGFAKAANQGIQMMLDRGVDEVLLLNPDTKMEEGALTSMLAVMRSNKQCGIVQPLLTLMKDPQKINTWGNEYRGFGLVSLGGYQRRVNGQWSAQNKMIQYASGACMLVKREVLENVGLLDERFFLYFEDTEFSQRVVQAGYEIWLASQAQVQHDYHLPVTWKKFRSFLSGWAKFYRMVQG